VARRPGDGGRNGRPAVPDTFNKTFFDSVREKVFEPTGLRCLFVADHEVASCPAAIEPTRDSLTVVALPVTVVENPPTRVRTPSSSSSCPSLLSRTRSQGEGVPHIGCQRRCEDERGPGDKRRSICHRLSVVSSRNTRLKKLEWFAVQEMADVVDARPVPDMFDQTFFDSVRKQVFEPRGLRGLFVATSLVREVLPAGQGRVFGLSVNGV